MPFIRVTLFCLAAFLPVALWASGPRIEFTVLDDKKRSRDRDKSHVTLTQQEDQSVTLSAVLTNREFGEVNDLKIRVFAFSKDPLNRSAPYQLVKIFEPEAFDLVYNEKKEIELGKVSFSHTEHREASHDRRYTDIAHIAVKVSGKGALYGGWAAELYHEGRLIKTYGSNSKTRKALKLNSTPPETK